MVTISGDQECEVHKGRHMPRPYATDGHHVWPKGMGGPDVKENIVFVCATGHQNIHAILRKLVAANGNIPKEDLKGFHAGEIKYAHLGYDRFTRKAL
jgi:hypothetical protein